MCFDEYAFDSGLYNLSEWKSQGLHWRCLFCSKAMFINGSQVYKASGLDFLGG